MELYSAAKKNFFTEIFEMIFIVEISQILYVKVSSVQSMQPQLSKLNVCGPFVKCEITTREWSEHLYPKWATIKITI